jgi:hypothetical protein
MFVAVPPVSVLIEKASLVFNSFYACAALLTIMAACRTRRPIPKYDWVQ